MNMEKLNILIVEDEFITALDLKTTLILHGQYDFYIVASGEEAVKIASIEKLDLIIMDIMLKGEMDGIEAAEKIKENQDVAIVFVSGNSDLLESERLQQTNPAGILKKPVTEYELMEVINSVFK